MNSYTMNSAIYRQVKQSTFYAIVSTFFGSVSLGFGFLSLAFRFIAVFGIILMISTQNIVWADQSSSQPTELDLERQIKLALQLSSSVDSSTDLTEAWKGVHELIGQGAPISLRAAHTILDSGVNQTVENYPELREIFRSLKIASQEVVDNHELNWTQVLIEKCKSKRCYLRGNQEFRCEIEADPDLGVRVMLTGVGSSGFVTKTLLERHHTQDENYDELILRCRNRVADLNTLLESRGFLNIQFNDKGLVELATTNNNLSIVDINKERNGMSLEYFGNIGNWENGAWTRHYLSLIHI